MMVLLELKEKNFIWNVIYLPPVYYIFENFPFIKRPIRDPRVLGWRSKGETDTESIRKMQITGDRFKLEQQALRYVSGI